jgi:hypothetical protein
MNITRAVQTSTQAVSPVSIAGIPHLLFVTACVEGRRCGSTAGRFPSRFARVSAA